MFWVLSLRPWVWRNISAELHLLPYKSEAVTFLKDSLFELVAR
jgi:hypothetical protein